MSKNDSPTKSEAQIDRIPTRDFRVRRRRSGDQLKLIRDNYIYEIDAGTDLIWQLCDGESTIAHIAARLANAGQWTQKHAQQIVTEVVSFFESSDLITWKDSVGSS